MCGIVAYVGYRNAVRVCIQGLAELEYRGYDASGIVFVANGTLEVVKELGRPENLRKKFVDGLPNSRIAIAHNRWATHGVNNIENAHPHSDCEGIIFLAHNGIIENACGLRENLSLRDHRFKSTTDTEIIAHLIEESNKVVGLEEAVRTVLAGISGSYALVIISKKEPEKIIAARNGSSLWLGMGNGEFFVASEPSAMLAFTKSALPLVDGDIAVIENGSLVISDARGERVHREFRNVTWNVEEAKREGYAHYTLKEIFQWPEAVGNSIFDRIKEGRPACADDSKLREKIRRARRIVSSACGTALYSLELGKYFIEQYAKLPVEVEIASEFYTKNSIIDVGDVFLTVSQSGETLDTLEALRLAQSKGAFSVSIVNKMGTVIPSISDIAIFQNIGREVGVASTKSFLSQAAILLLLFLEFAKIRETLVEDMEEILQGLKNVPALMRKVLAQSENVRALSTQYSHFHNFLYLGRKFNLPVAFEGALKLKELSYVHAEAYGAGEMKHGPLALIDKDFPTMAIAPRDSVYEKVISNIEEIKTRGGPLIAIATEGDERIGRLEDHVLYIPETHEALSPFLTASILQLFAYYVALDRGCDIDTPRNLAKSITVA